MSILFYSALSLVLADFELWSRPYDHARQIERHFPKAEAWASSQADILIYQPEFSEKEGIKTIRECAETTREEKGRESDSNAHYHHLNFEGG